MKYCNISKFKRKLVDIKTILLVCMISAILVKTASTALSEPNEGLSVGGISFPASNFFDVSIDTFNIDEVNFDKGWLGIFMEARKEGGITVKMTINGSPADVCGIKSDDIVMKINGKDIEGEGDDKLKFFKGIVEHAGKNSTVTLTVLRNGSELEFKPELISKLLDLKDIQRQKEKGGNHDQFIIDQLKSRKINEEDSFINFILKDDDYREKCLKTLQRIGEEICAREGYQYTSDKNMFRLPLIDHLMSHPFDVPISSDMVHDAFIGASPSNAVISAFKLLNCHVPVPGENIDKNGNESIQVLIENILSKMCKSLELRKKALKNLSDEEFQFLYDNSTEIWLDSPADETVMPRVLALSLKLDFDMLMNSVYTVVESIPFKRLSDIKPGALTLRKFNMPDCAKPEDKLSKSVAGMTGNNGKPDFAGDVLFVQETAIGTVVVGGTGTTYYYKDAAFIIDLGGDDYYLNNAGASTMNSPVSVCIDLSGNDIYTAKSDFAQGSGKFGAGILLDVNGDDQYVGAEYCQGFGLFGMGLLVDLTGNDTYNGHSMCQGGAAFGVGILRENSGHDTYHSGRCAQGIGFTKGVGAIFELNGNDVYFTGNKYADFRDTDRAFQSFAQGFAMGIRPDNSISGASGGIGLLLDDAGNDSYQGDYFAQGSSYYFSLGMLYDKSGHDIYQAGRYSQGAGIHSSIGILKDVEGNDMYNAYFGVSQACGYDTGIGYLLDMKGDDYYKCNVMAQGSGGEKGFGVMVDFAGNDYYFANGESMGFSFKSKNEDYFGLGILADIGGSGDVFNKKDIKPDTLLYQDNAGILINKSN